MKAKLVSIALLAMIVAGASAQPPEGFTPLFNGKDLKGWKVHSGKVEAWGVAAGVLFTSGSGGGWLMSEKDFANFELRLEYRLPVKGNSGVAIRSPLEGDPAYTGMEIQLLDDENYKGLRPSQYCGAIYDVVAPVRPAGRPAGQWNQMRIIAKEREVTVELNGNQVVQANLDAFRDLQKHPGLQRAQGHVGLQSHGSRVEFRNILIKPF
jgi:hypothetical protein